MHVDSEAEEDETVDLTQESDEDSDDAPEDWEANALDVEQFLNDLGLLSGRKTNPTREEVAKASDKSDIRRLTRGMTVLSKGARLQSKGLDLIKSVIEKRPDLEPLMKVLQPYASFTVHPRVSVKAEADVNIKFEAVSCASVHPKRTREGKYKCPVCPNVLLGSWSGCNSHINKVHKKLQYGPCRNCQQFTTTNPDSFTRHEMTCDGMIKKKKPMSTTL